VPVFKKAKARPQTSRKRSPSPSQSTSFSSDPSSSKSQVVVPSKKTTSTLLTSGTKRSLADRAAADSVDVKWSSTSGGAHSQAALDILDGDEAEELLAKRARHDHQDDSLDPPSDGKYHGMAGYKAHLKKSEDTPKAMRVGPQRSNNSTIRTVTIVDYQPDVCKDYKETGYCGFGDTCKFLHDRGTYLAGWQLDKLAENPTASARDEPDSDSDDEEVPFACLICRKPYTDPVVTRCGHYFCSACAIKRFAKTPKCAACGAPTGGIFNRAEKIIQKLKDKKQREEALKDMENGEAATGGGDEDITQLGDDDDEEEE
ncbi:hypothetical protein SISNIDRAFT_398571, partial [Sistotremastrum niveocremeum HHB9708]